MVSRRLSTYGLKLCEGDLVFDDTEEINNEIIDDEIEEDEQKKDETENIQQATNSSRVQAKVKALTKADIESNKYNIFDLVMPLPGHDVTYPSNECAQWYEDRLKQDNLTSEKLKLKQK